LINLLSFEFHRRAYRRDRPGSPVDSQNGLSPITLCGQRWRYDCVSYLPPLLLQNNNKAWLFTRLFVLYGQTRSFREISPMRRLNQTDQWIHSLNSGLATLGRSATALRPYPAKSDGLAQTGSHDEGLNAEQRRLSAGLMRVNHVGEVCAQGLYQAQSLMVRNAEIKEELLAASREELDHLAWTEQRLKELGARPSLLNPLWYLGAFGLGLTAAAFGPGVNLGFVRETERQVEAHLASHLDRLPINDVASRAIVEKMKADEKAHADHAEAMGAQELPPPIRLAMKWSASLMTRTAYYI
jgi:3-demethoxyubiquinol 3-hydroxylase